MVVTEEDRISHGETTSRSGQGQASPCRRCCASQTSEADETPSQQRRRGTSLLVVVAVKESCSANTVQLFVIV